MRREFSKQVKRQAFERANGLCEGKNCGAKLFVGKYAYDHVIPDALGGDPILDNCAILCKSCHAAKTQKSDVPTIAKAKRISNRHRGITTPRQKIKSAGFRKAPPQRTASRPLEKRT